MPRFHCPAALSTGAVLDLPAGAARHVQVLRLQPGQSITLFTGGAGARGGEYEATIEQMGRSTVQVRVGSHHALEREAAREVHLAIGMPANERMDWLVEKATELGVTSIQPLMTERSVLRMNGERAAKKLAHWQSIAIAACEQCGRNRVPAMHEVQGIQEWLQQPAPSRHKLLLSLSPGAQALAQAAGADGAVCFLSGPEGGLTPREEEAATRLGFVAVSLGLRVLRAETAAIAALATITLAQ